MDHETKKNSINHAFFLELAIDQIILLRKKG